MTKSALLVMDIQQAITDRVPDAGYLPRLVRAVGAARTTGFPVMYVVVGFRAGHPEINPPTRPSRPCSPEPSPARTPARPSTPTSPPGPASP
jgi:nicotinamidase-related amidase